MYRIDLDDLTVIHSAAGEEHDLNAYGAEITSIEELAAFVLELEGQGYYGSAVSSALLTALSA
tara:strand:- start:1522 stop:1710 length:189 start_codon:yes stop_codon:yes gene_type:complete